MASVNSPIRAILKPFLFWLLGKTGYKYAQFYGKMRDIKYRLVEEKEMELLPYFVKSGDTVIDIGANYAYYTDRLSGLVGKAGKVYSFEPIPFTHQICSMIVKKKKLNNVSLFNKGVSDKNETLTFKVPKLSFGGVSAGQAHIAGRTNESSEKKKYYNFEEEESFNCEVVALDSFGLNELDKLTFVKIDIEGAEYFAMMGMENLLKRYQPCLLIEVQPYFLSGFNIAADAFIKYITTVLGYSFFYYDEKIKKIFPLRQPLFDSNFVLIPTNKIEQYNQIIQDEA